ncbi:MAG: STAS domain-containing protein [bacterium]|nr:STAS domain-containing protein [bacterium]
MAVDSEIQGDVAILRLSGRFIGGDDVRVFRDGMQSLIDAGHVRVVADLGAVHLITSSSIGVLISGLQQVRKNGGDLLIAGTGKQMKNVFMVMQLERVFRFFDSVEEAVTVFGGE